MDFITKYVEQFKPHFVKAGTTAEAYAARILAQLERIGNAVESDEFVEVRRRFDGTIAAGTIEVAQVPSNQDWILETVALIPAAAGGAMVVRESGRMRYADSVTIPKTAKPELLFNGGSVVTLTAVDQVEYYLQFKVERHEARRSTNSAGAMEWQPYDGVPDPRQEAQQEARHMPTGIVAGRNVNGARHP